MRYTYKGNFFGRCLKDSLSFRGCLKERVRVFWELFPKTEIISKESCP